MFTVCSHLGVPCLHPIILPLVPCPFWGDPSDWSQVRMGYPKTGYPPRDGVPSSQVRMGVPHVRYPQPGMGYPPRIGQQSSTCYMSGGMPFAFMQEDYLDLSAAGCTHYWLIRKIMLSFEWLIAKVIPK